MKVQPQFWTYRNNIFINNNVISLLIAMLNTNQLFESTLIESLELFKQYGLYHESNKKEAGIASLMSAQEMITNPYYIIQAPKWGCTFEYLTQRYNLDDNTDDILYELDVTINYQLNINEDFIYNEFFETLWINGYLLQRFLNNKSQLKYLTQQSIRSMLLLYVELIEVPQTDMIRIEPQFYFISSVCIELKKFLQTLSSLNLCISETKMLLDNILMLEQSSLLVTSKFNTDDLYRIINPLSPNYHG